MSSRSRRPSAPPASPKAPARPVALAGFMGAGKTTVGTRLASLLGWPFHDTDGWVEEVSGRRVEDFFSAGEEPEFRRLEAAAVTSLLDQGEVVIALGGGALMNERSRAALLERALLVYLDVDWPELSERIPALVATRPLLRGRSLEEVHDLYRRRLPSYQLAPVRVSIGRRPPEEVAAEIAARLTGTL